MTQQELRATCYRQMAIAEKAIAELRYALGFLKLEATDETASQASSETDQGGLQGKS